MVCSSVDLIFSSHPPAESLRPFVREVGAGVRGRLPNDHLDSRFPLKDADAPTVKLYGAITAPNQRTSNNVLSVARWHRSPLVTLGAAGVVTTPSFTPATAIWAQAAAHVIDAGLHRQTYGGTLAGCSCSRRVLMENSQISWTNHTFNPWWGCKRVSPACKECYIGPIMRRAGREPFGGPIRTSADNWRKPYRWNRMAESEGCRHFVFTCSMSDYFHPGADAWRDEAWAVIRACSNLDWLVLTKRPQLMEKRMPADWDDGYPNVWLGVTVESQKFVHRIDRMLTVPATTYFVSAEPLLGPIDFDGRLADIDWVIGGCERAGRNIRRPMDPQWVRQLRDQCARHNTAFFLKQYYVGNQIQEDGMLDGTAYLNWPSQAVGR